MKKILLALCALSVLFLSGCSIQKTMTLKNTTVDEVAQAGKNFAELNGYKIISEDEKNHIYNCNCVFISYRAKMPASITAISAMYDPPAVSSAGFAYQLKQNGNDVDVIFRSYGYGLDGFVFNKSGRMINYLHQQGFRTRGLTFTTL